MTPSSRQLIPPIFGILFAGAFLDYTKTEAAEADVTPRFEAITSFSRSPEHPARSGLINHPSGLYGTASEGGNFNCGAIFRASGTTTSHLLHFTGQTGVAKGDAPSGALVTDGTNYIWGVTTRGGVGDAGTVYRFNTSTNSLSTVVEFGAELSGSTYRLGRNPTIGLTRDGNGYLWGISDGTPAVIYKVHPGIGQSFAVAVIAPDQGSKLGLTPRGELTFDGVDSLWGVTADGGSQGYGLVYKVHQDSGEVTVVTTLTGPSGAARCNYPTGSLVLETGGGAMLGLCAPLNPATSAGNVFRIKLSDNTFSVSGTLTNSAPMAKVKEGLINLQDGTYAGLAESSRPYGGALFVWTPTRPSSVDLYPFDAGTQRVRGIDPVSLAPLGGGRLAGATLEGGTYDKGVIFTFFAGFNPNPAMLGSANDWENTHGSLPSGGLSEGEGGRLWGLTRSGGHGTPSGAGVAYSFLPSDDQVTVPFGFSNTLPYGRHPVGELVRTPDLAHQAARFLWGQAAGGTADAAPYAVFRIMDNTFYYPTDASYARELTLNSEPNAGLTRASSGKFWSAAGNSVYWFDPAASQQVTTAFTLTGTLGPIYGSQPSSRMYKDDSGLLWGTTEAGGDLNFGTIFKIEEYHGPTFTSVVKFTGASGHALGSRPNSPLAPGSSGFLWGTTAAGGSSGLGTVFKLQTSSGALTTVATFGTGAGTVKGAAPRTGLTADGRGYLWGSTSAGGASGRGTIFRIHLATEAFETVFDFTGSNTTAPGTGPCTPLLLHSDGNLYGTTPGLSQPFNSQPRPGGNVFRIRLGKGMGVRLNNTALVDGVPLPFREAPALQNVYDIEDSRTLTLLVTNPGPDPITGFTATLSGPQAADFTVMTTVPGTLNPSQSIQLAVKFDPSALGKRDATLILGGASPDTDAFVLPLSGTCVQRTVAFENIGESVIEDSGQPLGVRVKLSAPLSTAVKVPFTVAMGSVTTADVSISASPVVIPAGATSGTIWITPKKDYLIEGNETILIGLGTPSHPKVAVTTQDLYKSCEVTITDDDELPTFSEGAGGVFTLGQPFGVASNLSNPSNLPFTGTWRLNGKVIAGATQPFYRLPKAAASNAGSYQYTIRTVTGNTLAGTPFDVWVIDNQPHIMGITKGKTAALAIVAAGRGLSFRWTRIVADSEVPVSNGGRISDATSSTLKIALADTPDAGRYRCYYAINGYQIEGIDFDLFVPTEIPVAATPQFPPAQVGRLYEYTVSSNGGAAAAPASVTATGLPLGLVCHPVTGLISGRPAQAGKFKVTITLGNSAGKDSTSADLIVTGLPDYLPGKYTAMVTGGPIGSRMDLTVTTSGGVTGYMTTGTVRRLFSGRIELSEAGDEAHCHLLLPGSNSAAQPLLRMDLVFTPDHLMGGSTEVYYAFTSESGGVIGWKNTWNTTTRPASHVYRYHTLTVQTGDECWGRGSLTVGLDGTTVISGRLADGSGFSTTSFLHPDNLFMLYQSLYSDQGGLVVLGQITPHGAGSAFDISSANSTGLWQIPRLPTTSRYTSNPLFNNASYGVTLVGSSYQKPATGHNLLELPVVPLGTSNALFRFSISSIIVPTPPDVIFHLGTNHRPTLPAPGSAGNPGHVNRVSFDPATGAFTGEFIVDAGTARSRTANFNGMVLPGLNKGVGYLTIAGPANPLVVPAITVFNSPFQVGTVILEPYTAPASP